jgi:hypothetical protein
MKAALAVAQRARGGPVPSGVDTPGLHRVRSPGTAGPTATRLQTGRAFTISQPGDRHEQEAERAAEQVVRAPGRSPADRPALSRLSAPPLQRQDVDEPPPDPIVEGMGTVFENLGENNPAFGAFTDQLAADFLSQPPALSVGVPVMVGASYAFVWGMALVNPAMRRHADDFNLALLPGIVPLFPVKDFTYRILDDEQTRFAFDIGLDATSLIEAFNDGVFRTPLSALSFESSGTLATGAPSPVSLSALEVHLGLFGDGLTLSGGFRGGVSPYPLFEHDPLAGASTRVMQQLPALPDLYPGQRDLRFTLMLDIPRLVHHFGAGGSVPMPSPPDGPDLMRAPLPDRPPTGAAGPTEPVAGAAAVTATASEAVQAALATPGQPLDGSTRRFMEPRFGHDFGHVRIHADEPAAASARALAARAYTLGSEVVFGRGQYAPSSAAGRRLLAHELAHVVQQTGTTVAVQRDDDEVERKKQEAERERARKRLEAWAQGRDPKPSTDPTHKDFAFTAQALAHEITHKPAPDETELLDKPADKAKAVAWQTAFRDAYQLALMILDSTGTEQRESRAALIAGDLATAGFTTEAMAVAARLPDEHKENVYEEVAKAAAKAGTDQVRTVSGFFARRKSSPGDHPLLSRLTDRSGRFARELGKDRLLATLEPTLAAYRKDADYLEDLAEILVFDPGTRVAISDWLWTADKDFLFEILETDYFGEPGYDVSQFADDQGQPRELTMAADMPWVYAYKQKYYTDFLVRLGAKHQVAIPAPASLKFANLRAWLDAQTAAIGQALAAEHPHAPERITAAYQQIADIFFFHVDRGDVVPDLGGRLGHLGPADPSGMRLKSDCDVLATYATRLLRASGFTPVGYLAVVPDSGPSHAVALLKKAQPSEAAAEGESPKPGPDRYYIVNNKQVTPRDSAGKEAAIKAALKDALLVYDPEPASYRVYYEDAAANGAMTRALWTTAEAVRRRDLGKDPPSPPAPAP